MTLTNSYVGNICSALLNFEKPAAHHFHKLMRYILMIKIIDKCGVIIRVYFPSCSYNHCVNSDKHNPRYQLPFKFKFHYMGREILFINVLLDNAPLKCRVSLHRR